MELGHPCYLDASHRRSLASSRWILPRGSLKTWRSAVIPHHSPKPLQTIMKVLAKHKAPLEWSQFQDSEAKICFERDSLRLNCSLHSSTRSSRLLSCANLTHQPQKWEPVRSRAKKTTIKMIKARPLTVRPGKCSAWPKSQTLHSKCSIWVTFSTVMSSIRSDLWPCRVKKWFRKLNLPLWELL